MNFIKQWHKGLIIYLTPIFLIGCSELLHENPKSSVNHEKFYTNAKQIEGIFAGSMDNLYGGWGPYDSHYEYAEMDDQYGSGNLVISPDYGNRMWNSHYKSISDLNHAIKSITEGSLEGTESQSRIEELMGKAKFLRGWNYFQLVRYYGPLPLLTDTTKNYYNAKLGRSSISDVYDFILNDFKAAIEKIPVSQKQGQPTKDVAKAMMAEVYLTMATYPLNERQYYSKAAKYAWEVIQGGKYSLVESVTNVFSEQTRYGPEVMWAFHATDEDQTIEANTWYDFDISLEWLNKFPDEPRRYAWFKFTDLEGNDWKDAGVNPSLKKYLYAGDVTTGKMTADMPIMRYAEVLMIYAEAANMTNGGPTKDAVWALNKVIERANGYEENPEHLLVTMSMTQEAFDEKVIEERNWELCFEESKRWFDLVRKRILKEKVKDEYMKNFSEDDYLWPIPQYDLRNNPNLTQNPGYENPYK